MKGFVVGYDDFVMNNQIKKTINKLCPHLSEHERLLAGQKLADFINTIERIATRLANEKTTQLNFDNCATDDKIKLGSSCTNEKN